MKLLYLAVFIVVEVVEAIVIFVIVIVVVKGYLRWHCGLHPFPSEAGKSVGCTEPVE